MIATTRRTAILFLALAVAVTVGCGTRVDETASEPQTIVVSGGDGGAALEETGTDGTSQGSTGNAAVGSRSGSGGSAGSDVAGTRNTAPGETPAGRPSGPATGEPIVVGAVGTRSGIVGAALEGSWRGLVVWEEWVNANGGIGGRPVEVVAADDGGDPGKHAAAIRRLISEEGVVAFVGNFAPTTFSAGVPLLEDAGVPALGGDGGEASWFQSPMAFPINGQGVSRSRPAAKWALANRSERHAAVFYVSEVAAPGVLARNFSDEWRRGGGQVVLEAGVSLAQVDFTGEVVRAKDAGADIVYMVLEKSACNRFFSAARRQQFTPVWVAPACVIDNARDHKDLTTDRFYAVHSARPVRPDSSPAEDEILEAVSRYDPSLSPDGAFMFAWLGGRLLEEALAQPGAEPTAAGIVAALHALPATTLGGLTPAQAWPPGPHGEVGCGMISAFDGANFVLQTGDFVC